MRVSPLCSLHLNNERPSKINNSTRRPSLLVCLHGGRNFCAEIYKFNQQSHSLGPTPPSYGSEKICTLPALILHGYLSSFRHQIGGNGQNVGWWTPTVSWVIDRSVFC